MQIEEDSDITIQINQVGFKSFCEEDLIKLKKNSNTPKLILFEEKENNRTIQNPSFLELINRHKKISAHNPCYSNGEDELNKVIINKKCNQKIKEIIRQLMSVSMKERNEIILSERSSNFKDLRNFYENN